MKVINGIKMFSTKDLQELLGVSPYVLTKYRKSGLLRSVYVGKSYYTSEQSLSDFLNGYTIKDSIRKQGEEQ